MDSSFEPPADAGEEGSRSPLAIGYVELHCHSNFSLLDGASHIEELVQAAVELGYPALALTDHDNLYGALRFAQACHEHGLRPITGLELTLAEDPEQGDRYHLTLLAAERQGYANLCRLASLAHGFHLATQSHREHRRRDPCLPRALLAAHTEGVICLTGCRQGELSQLVDRDQMEQAAAALTRLRGEFSPGALYVELQDNLVSGDRDRGAALCRLAADAGVAVVATGNVHYHVRDRHRLQDALVAIRLRTTLQASHQQRRPNSEFHLRDPAVQVRRFRHHAAAATSLEIAQRCHFDLTADLGYRLPSPPMVEGRSPGDELTALCRQRLEVRYPLDERGPAEARLQQELKLIEQHDLAGFFLIYHEVMQLAEEVAREVRGGTPRADAALSPGRGRGSSVGSIVCYLIGLSHIDPVRNRLFLGRFLNDEMRSLPDIDLDFPRDIRARLFERVYEHWGQDHAALVATFPTYRIRSAIRDLGRALGLPARELDRLAKFSEGYGSARALSEEMSRLPQFAPLIAAPGWRDLIALSHELAGFPRHLSQHVGGVVISSEPLIDCVPIEPAAWPNRYLCHWDKDSIEDAHMVKIDILGLGMLSLVEECIEHIATNRKERVDLSRIDFSDARVYDRLATGDTIGVFQVESRAQSSMLPRSQPRNLEDMAAQVAIIRPGPIVGGAVHPYLMRRERQRHEPDYIPEVPHELLRPVLGETLGVVIYQEQVLQVAMAMGGFSTGDAEQLRRSMSRRSWEHDEPEWRARFVAGAHLLGVAQASADSVFDTLCGFAGFGFPKSHSVAFGLLAYQSAWLKEYFPVEFYCALLNQWPMGFYPPHVVAHDARRHGIEVLRPDINSSFAHGSVESTSRLRLGLSHIEGIGPTQAAHLVAERQRHGDYQSLFDLVQRGGVPREAMENLIQVGTLDSLGLNRRELIWQLGLLRPEAGRPWRARASQLQLDLSSAADRIALPDFDDYARMSGDYAVLGLSPDHHPMEFLRPALSSRVLRSSALAGKPVGRQVEVAGLVVCRQKPETAHGAMFLSLEDEDGLINVVVSPELYERHRLALRTSAFLLVNAVIQAWSGPMAQLRARRIDSLRPDRPVATPSGHNFG